MSDTRPILLTAALLIAQASLAGEPPFTGLRLGLGAGLGSSHFGLGQLATDSNFSVYVTQSPLPGSMYKLGTPSGSSARGRLFTPLLDLSYGLPLGERWLATIGLRADLGRQSEGGLSLIKGVVNPIGIPVAPTNFVLRGSLQLKQQFSLYFQPGYKLNERWQLYGLLSYHQSQARLQPTLNVAGQASRSLGELKRTLSGYGVGLGAEHALGKRLSLRMDLQRVQFAKTEFTAANHAPLFNLQQQTNRFNTTIGYRF